MFHRYTKARNQLERRVRIWTDELLWSSRWPTWSFPVPSGIPPRVRTHPRTRSFPTQPSLWWTPSEIQTSRCHPLFIFRILLFWFKTFNCFRLIKIVLTDYYNKTVLFWTRKLVVDTNKYFLFGFDIAQRSYFNIYIPVD